MTWFTRWRARLDVIALRLGYLSAGPEHRLAATLQEFDEDGVWRCRVMYIADVPAFIEREWERTAGQPASAVD